MSMSSVASEIPSDMARSVCFVVGYDHSQAAENALQLALRHAEDPELMVSLWIIMGVNEHHLFQDRDAEHKRNLQKAAVLEQRILEGPVILGVRTLVRDEDPKKLLLEQIHHLHAERCYVGRLGHGSGLVQKLIGSVGEYLQKNAPEWCRIEIVD